jgi:hypothetical protein
VRPFELERTGRRGIRFLAPGMPPTTKARENNLSREVGRPRTPTVGAVLVRSGKLTEISAASKRQREPVGLIRMWMDQALRRSATALFAC